MAFSLSTLASPDDPTPAAETRVTSSTGKTFWVFVAVTLGFNATLFGLLVGRPVSHATLLALDNVAQFAGPLLILPLCFPDWRWSSLRQPRAERPVTGRRSLAPALLGLGIFSFAAGQMIWAYYELVLHQATPFPSLADVGFMAEYPFLMLGILLLPTRPLSSRVRVRVAFDGFMILCALVTFSWYFILGPTLLQGGESILAKVVGSAYPAWDLVLIACLFVLFAHRRDAVSAPALLLLTAGLGFMVVTDSLFDFMTLNNTYATGALIDVGWPLACMVLGLGAYVVRTQPSCPVRAGRAADDEAAGAWGEFVPYALVPCVAALLFYVTHYPGDRQLRAGVELGSAVLVILLLARQVLAIEETRRLSWRLRAKNRELEAANQRLQSLATTDPLTDLPNHRALVAALDLELERAFRYNRPCSVLFLDLDHFKTLNDTQGHPSGDAALSGLAAILRESLRGIDLVGRWGGEEFVAILPETDGEAAVQTAERVRQRIAAHVFPLPVGRARLTCSIGVAAYPNDAEDRAGLVDVADRAMYGAKKLGRNQVRAARDPALEHVYPGSVHDVTDQYGAVIRTVEALVALVETRDLYTGRHGHRVARLATRLAYALGRGGHEANVIGLAAKLHDIGKIGIPDAVLQKPGRLTPEEWKLVRAHPVVGSDIMRRMPELEALAPIVRGHHERWDGTGYPDALGGPAIPIGARIVAVADAYCAMTSDRPYRQRMPEADALAEVVRCSGTQFEPQVVDALERVLTVERSGGMRDAS